MKEHRDKHRHRHHRLRRHSSQKSDTSSAASGGATANHNDGAASDGKVRLYRDEITFHDMQKNRLHDIEKKLEEEVSRKRKDWEKEDGGVINSTSVSLHTNVFEDK